VALVPDDDEVRAPQTLREGWALHRDVHRSTRERVVLDQHVGDHAVRLADCGDEEQPPRADLVLDDLDVARAPTVAVRLDVKGRAPRLADVVPGDEDVARSRDGDALATVALEVRVADHDVL